MKGNLLLYIFQINLCILRNTTFFSDKLGNFETEISTGHPIVQVFRREVDKFAMSKAVA